MRNARTSSCCCLVVDGAAATAARCSTLDAAVRDFPDTPIADEWLGTPMLYSSGHDRPAQRDPAPAAREPAVAAAAAVRFLVKTVAIPRGHDLSLARAAVPLGAAGRGGRWPSATAAPRSSWSTSIPSSTWRSIEQLPRHAQPARADHVLPHAQAARGRAPTLRPVVAGDRDPRRGAVPGAGEGADDRVVGTDHPRVLRRHRRASASPPATAPSGSRTAARWASVLLGDLHVLDET